MIIDTHVHLVSFRIREEFQRIGLSAVFNHCSPDELREPIDSLLSDMEKAGVDTSLIVTCCNLETFELPRKKHPDKLFVAFLYDSRNPKEALRNLRKAVEKHPGFVRCAKTIFPYLGQDPLEKEFHPLYKYCETQKLPIQFHMGGDTSMELLSDPLYFGKLAESFPELKIICLHAGGGMVKKMPLLMSLWPNIYLEVEALQLHEAEGSRNPETLRYLLGHVDSNRMMFGSDRIFPEKKYFWRVQAAREASPEHAENLCWKTANKLFELGLEKRKKRHVFRAEAGVPKRQRPPKREARRNKTKKAYNE